MTRYEAREYFLKNELTYADITSGDICVLMLLLNKNIKQACKKGEMSVCTMRMSEKIVSKYTSSGKLIQCYLLMNSHYFRRRDCISFNYGGFIDFAVWADDSNLKPIIDAFIQWCDILVDQRVIRE